MRRNIFSALLILSFVAPAADAAAQHRIPSGYNELRSGEYIKKHQYLESYNGRYRLYLQGDGNLVLKGDCRYSRRGGKVRCHEILWASCTHRDGGKYLTLQSSDGNLVLYRKRWRKPVWASRTDDRMVSHYGDALILTNNGRLLLVNYGHIVWEPHYNYGCR